MYRCKHVPLNTSQISNAFGRPGGGAFPCTCPLLLNSFIHVIKTRERETDRERSLYPPPFPSPLLLATRLFFCIEKSVWVSSRFKPTGCLKRARAAGRKRRKSSTLYVTRRALSPLIVIQEHGMFRRRRGTINKENIRFTRLFVRCL